MQQPPQPPQLLRQLLRQLLLQAQAQPRVPLVARPLVAPLVAPPLVAPPPVGAFVAANLAPNCGVAFSLSNTLTIMQLPIYGSQAKPLEQELSSRTAVVMHH